jgi:RNA polymerase sigma factor (sigma-70 family)
VNDQTDPQLLRAYVERRCEPAFAELVRRHVDFIYSAALRMVCDSHLAQDVTQGVFLALAKNAAQLTERPVLSGWLHRTAQNIAAQTVRADVRRRAREQEAATMNELLATEPGADWEQIAPHLDAALVELSEPDRDALFLRYFQRKSAREMAHTLGTSEEAAQKRVNRAVERLRECFVRRGVTVGASGLVVVISTHAIQAAPVGLAVAISTAATLTGTALATTATASTLKTIAMTTLQKTLIATLVVASIATPLVVYTKSAARQRAAEESLRQQGDELTDQQAEHERLSALAGQTDSSTDRSADLARLRAEAEALRKQTNTLPRVRAENRRLQAAADLPDVEPSEAEKQEVNVRMTASKNWAIASFLYSRKNQGQFPPTIEQAAAFYPDKARAATNSTTDQFEVVYQGSLSALSKPQGVIVVRQKEALPYGNRWAKVYGYGDGHVEMHVQAESDFDSWEKQHIAAPAPGSPKL